MSPTESHLTPPTDVIHRPAGNGPSRFPRTQPPIVRIQHVNHHFGQGEARKQALYANNLELMPGEIVIMTGPSGSGKTTLLTLIGGLRTIQDGKIEVLGQELSGLGAPELVQVRRDIGFIFQAHNLFASLTAYQNVKMALELKDFDPDQGHQRILTLLNQLGLGQRVQYKPQNLSGGQRQRVAICRALVNRPKLILADEPTAALDKESGRHVVNLLQKLAREEACTSLIVTHDNRILDVADRIVNMVDGKIISNVLVEETVVISEFLRQCPVFSDLPLSALSNVASQMHREHFDAGTAIIRQGGEGDKFYLIRSGQVDVIISDGQTSRTVATLGEGQFFGEMALVENKPRNATVVAKDDVEVYTLGKAAFQAVLDTSPTLKEELRNVIFQRQELPRPHA